MAEKDVFVIQKGHQPGRQRSTDRYQPRTSTGNPPASVPPSPPAHLFQSAVVSPKKTS